MSAPGALPLTDPPPTSVMEMGIYQTEVDPSVALLYNQISRQTLVDRSKTLWGTGIARDIRHLVDAAFKGFSYDRDYPRELFIDHQHNQLWACCYKRPKRQDPLGVFLVKTVIPFPAFLSLAELQPNRCPALTLNALTTWGDANGAFMASRVPLLGLPGYQESFLQETLPAQQIVTVAEQYQNAVYRHLDLRWYLIPTDLKLTKADLAQRVNAPEFYASLRGHYPVVRENIERLLTYLTHHGITPYFLVSNETYQRNLSIVYTFDLLTDDDQVYVVSGSLAIAQRRRKELQ